MLSLGADGVVVGSKLVELLRDSADHLRDSAGRLQKLHTALDSGKQQHTCIYLQVVVGRHKNHPLRQLELFPIKRKEHFQKYDMEEQNPLGTDKIAKVGV